MMLPLVPLTRKCMFAYIITHSFIHHTRFLPLGSGTYSPECVSIRVPVLAAGIPAAPHPYVVYQVSL